MTTDTAPTPDMPGAAKDAQAPSRRHMDLSGVAFSRPRAILVRALGDTRA